MPAIPVQITQDVGHSGANRSRFPVQISDGVNVREVQDVPENMVSARRRLGVGPAVPDNRAESAGSSGCVFRCGLYCIIK